MKPKQRKVDTTLETIIILLIAILLLVLIRFANLKLDELIQSDREALLMTHDELSPIHDELAKEIVEFRPDACKMIEVFSSDFKLLFTVQFLEDVDEYNNIEEYPDLMDLLYNNKEGHTTIDIGDKTEDVYFRWTETSEGDPYLVLIYMSRPTVGNFWIFNLICYLILLLVFILFIVLRMRSFHECVSQYKNTSAELQNVLMHD